MKKTTLTCGVLALFTAPAFAQYQFETTFGTALAALDDGISASQALGFTFAMPGGGSVTTVDIDANGRILPGGGAELSDFSESTAELLTEAHSSICVQWDDLNMASAAAGVDDIYFNTDGSTKAWITWNNAVQFGATVLHTFQAQLFSDGRIVLLYDSRCPALDGLVGLSSGAPATANAVDLSTAPFSTGVNPTVYQLFTAAWDLQSTALEFAPSGTGYNVAKNAVTNINAAITGTGAGCYGPDGPCIVYTPNGPGYDVTKTTGLYDTNIGASAGLTGDDQISLTNHDLTFSFTFPGGSASQFIDIDTNGRILRDGTETASDNTPTVGEFRTEAWPAIAVCHADWNIAATGSDDIYFSTTAGTSARITWRNVLQFGAAAGAVTCTFQAQLYSSGVIVICLKDLRGFNQPAALADDMIVGVSPGGGIADPGETNYVTLVGTANTGAINYELIDQPADLQAYTPLDPLLVSLTTPKLSSNWDLRIDRLPPGTTQAWFMIGFSNPVQDLGPGVVDVPCTLRTNDEVTIVATLPGGSSTGVLSIAIGPSVLQVGLTAYVQGVTASTGVNPFLPIVLSNGIAGTVGF